MTFVMDFLWRLMIVSMASAAAILFVATLTNWMLRRHSSALRHRVWALSQVAVLVLPLGIFLLPQWGPDWSRFDLASPLHDAYVQASAGPLDVEAVGSSAAEATGDDFAFSRNQPRPVLPTSNSGLAFDIGVDSRGNSEEIVPLAHAGVTAIPTTSSARRARIAILSIWLLGVAIGLLWLTRGQIDAARLIRTAVPITDRSTCAEVIDLRSRLGVRQHVPLLCSPTAIVPMTLGTFRSVIILPAGYGKWNKHRRQLVLAHELAHILRRDVLAHWIAGLACVFYWCDPLVWIAYWRTRVERERACDDVVLSEIEGKPAQYASELVNVAAALSRESMPLVCGVAMASRSHLEQRIRAILDPALRRTKVTPSLSRALVVLTLATVVLLSLLSPSLSQNRVFSSPNDSAKEDLVEKHATDEEQRVGHDRSQILKPPSEDGPTTIHIGGHVLGPDGEPFSGARLFLSYHAKEYTKPRVRTESGDDGRFQFHVSSQQIGELLGDVQVVAMAPGYGLDWTNLIDEQNKTRDLTLRLIPDAPIEGRVMDLEGLPVVGATVEISALRATPQENLDSLLKSWKSQEEGLSPMAARDQLLTKRLMWPESVGLTSTKTDVSGTFRLSGYGKDRWLGLVVSGPRIAKEYVTVLARPKSEVESLVKVKRPFAPTFGTKFEYTASPSKPIVGTVRDSATMEPIVGARVYRRDVHSITDADGRYRLDGVAKTDRYWVGVKSDTHFLARAEKGDTPGFDPITIDLEMDRGVALHIRLKDKSTGRPVRGSFAYYAAVGNTSVEGTAFAADPYSGTLGETEPDGTGTLVVYPGPGYLCIRASENRFVPEHLATANDPAPLQQIKAIPNRFEAGLYHVVKRIDPRRDAAKALHLEIELDPGEAVEGSVTGPGGQALDDVIFAGKTPLREWALPGFETLQSPRFSVVGLGDKSPRTVLFIQQASQLAKAVEISPGPAATPKIALEPLGILIGQVVDETGKPRTNIVVRAQVRGHEVMRRFGIPKPRTDSLAHTLWGDMDLRNQVLNRSAKVDAAGRFQIVGLVSGLTYDLYSLVDGKLFHLASDVSISPKKTRDVGAIRLRPVRQ